MTHDELDQAKNDQPTPEKPPKDQGPQGIINWCAGIFAFICWVMSLNNYGPFRSSLGGAFIAGAVGGGIGAAIGMFIQWQIVDKIKKRKFMREADQMKTEALPQTIVVRRSLFGGFWFSQWHLEVLPQALKLRSKNGKQEYCVSRAHAEKAIRFDRGLIRQIYITCDDGQAVNLQANQQCWQKLDWWVHHGWGN